MEIKLLSTDKQGTPCSECKKFSFPITPKLLEGYFYKQELKCPICNAKHDLWNLLIRHFELEFLSYLYAVVGSNNTWAEIIMKPNEVFALDLEKIGITKKAKILNISYTPQEKGILPIELHGNTPIRHFIPNKINLFGKPQGDPVEKARVLIVIHWVENNEENELWQNLIEAVDAFSVKDLQATIIPANVSVESRLTPIISEYLERSVSKTRIKTFLSQAATYSHQLNVLLPLIASFENFPSMPEFLRGNLNRLRDLRNELAHHGKINNLERMEVATLLCSATFGLSYLDIFDKQLKSKKAV